MKHEFPRREASPYHGFLGEVNSHPLDRLPLPYRGWVLLMVGAGGTEVCEAVVCVCGGECSWRDACGVDRRLLDYI